MDGSGVAFDLDAELARMFKAHAAFVSRVLRRFGVRAADLPDACQDVFLVVHRRLPEFEGRAAYRTWLYRICVCVASDYRKRAHRRHERFGHDAHEARDADVLAAPDHAAGTAQLAQRIAQALDRLDEAKRRVFLLYELEELSMIEVAARVGCPLKTAFSRLYAARREVRAELERAGIAGAFGVLWWLRPLRAHAAWWCGAAATQAGALACAAGLITVAALGATRTHAGPSLVAEASAESTLAAFTPLRAPIPSTPLPAPRIAPDTRSTDVPPRVPSRRPARKAEAARMPAPLARAVLAPPPAAPEWIHAPAPERVAPAAETARPQVGLDEVLAATSIKPLMRFGPAGGAAAEPFSLVPRRARVR